MSQHIRFWYLLHMQAGKAWVSLQKWAVLSEPLLLRGLINDVISVELSLKVQKELKV